MNGLPITNPAWTFHEGLYIAEASDLVAGQCADPFGRALPAMTPGRDNEGDVVRFSATIFYAGDAHQLLIIND